MHRTFLSLPLSEKKIITWSGSDGGKIALRTRPTNLRRGSWNFRFFGSGQFLFRFFGFRTFKTVVFRFRCLVRFMGLLLFSLWFSVLSAVIAVFQFVLSNSFYCFSGFANEVTPCSRAKIVIPREHLYSILPFLLEEWMTNLVC